MTQVDIRQPGAVELYDIVEDICGVSRAVERLHNERIVDWKTTQINAPLKCAEHLSTG